MLFFTFQFVPMVLYLIFSIFYSENFHQAQISIKSIAHFCSNFLTRTKHGFHSSHKFGKTSNLENPNDS
ncbi:hypothetical protein AL024_00005 [Enterococcus faecium]|nr:hypothetical protein AL024_00005 [Enterococcus faecium]